MNQEQVHYLIATIWQCNTVGISQGEVNLSGAFVHLTKGTGVENRMAKQSLSAEEQKAPSEKFRMFWVCLFLEYL